MFDIFLQCPFIFPIRAWISPPSDVAKAARKRVQEFQKYGIKGVDLYLSCFGPALQELSQHWPLTRSQSATKNQTKKQTNQLV